MTDESRATERREAPHEVLDRFIAGIKAEVSRSGGFSFVGESAVYWIARFREIQQALTLPSAVAANRDEIIEECAKELDKRCESLNIMSERAGHTREGNDLGQRSSATWDAANIVRALKNAAPQDAGSGLPTANTAGPAGAAPSTPSSIAAKSPAWNDIWKAWHALISEMKDQLGENNRAWPLAKALNELLDVAYWTDEITTPSSATTCNDEDAERYRWFRTLTPATRADVLEAAGDEAHMLDHFIDKGRCGL